MVKRVDNAVYDIVKLVVEGKFQAGFHVFGLESDGVGYVIDEYNATWSRPMQSRPPKKRRRKLCGTNQGPWMRWRTSWSAGILPAQRA